MFKKETLGGEEEDTALVPRNIFCHYLLKLHGLNLNASTNQLANRQGRHQNRKCPLPRGGEEGTHAYRSRCDLSIPHGLPAEIRSTDARRGPVQRPEPVQIKVFSETSNNLV